MFKNSPKVNKFKKDWLTIKLVDELNCKIEFKEKKSQLRKIFPSQKFIKNEQIALKAYVSNRILSVIKSDTWQNNTSNVVFKETTKNQLFVQQKTNLDSSIENSPVLIKNYLKLNKSVKKPIPKRCSSEIMKTVVERLKVNNTKPTLIIPKSRNNSNFFPDLAKIESNKSKNSTISSLIFNPLKKTNKRQIMTINFLKEKLGLEKFNKVQNLYQLKNRNLFEIESILTKSQKCLTKLFPMAFDFMTPTTQESVEI